MNGTPNIGMKLSGNRKNASTPGPDPPQTPTAVLLTMNSIAQATMKSRIPNRFQATNSRRGNGRSASTMYGPGKRGSGRGKPPLRAGR
jgi:hypothetical protein